MKKVVVFGATGSIGAYFTDYCKEKFKDSDYEVVAVGRRKTDFFGKHGISYINVDICKDEGFSELPQSDVLAVVHLAGLLPAYVQKYDPFAYIETNVKGSLRILEYARKVHADRILFAQTWSEQGGYWGKETVLSPKLGRNLIYTGDHAFYAITKTMVCEMMEHYKQEYGIRNFVFRLPNVYLYHPSREYYVDCKKKLVAYRYMIDRAEKGLPIEMWGDPNAFKDVLYVKDLCQMMYKALFAPCDGGTYNAGTGIATTLRQQIEGMIQVFSPKDHPSIIIEKPSGAGFTSFVMDISNAREDLGYEPEYTYTKYLDDYKIEQQKKRFDALWGKS